MKKTKKVISIILSLLMVLGMMSTFVFAEDTPTYSITINDTRSGRTYTAYQILEASSVKGTSLGNVGWGYNITPGTGDKITIGEGESAVSYTAAEFANYLSTMNFSQIKAFAKTIDNLKNTNPGFSATEKTTTDTETGTTTTTGYVIDLTVENAGIGYYLVLETGAAGAHDEFSDFIIKVVGSATASPKIAKGEGKIPTIAKTPATQSVTVGEKAKFTLTATLPTNLEDYSSYKLEFYDTLNEGLTYNNDVKVYVGNTELSSNNYSIEGPTYTNNFLKITLNDVRDLNNVASTGGGGDASETVSTPVDVNKDSEIVVTYTATVTKASTDSKTFVAATNEVYLKYSNDPKVLTKLGQTDTKTVNVTNTKIIINKVDGSDSKPLDGAGFTLYKAASATATSYDKEKDTEYVTLNPTTKSVSERGSLTKSTAESGIFDKFTFTGLGDGTYWLVESTTPDGYNTLNPVKIVITSNSVNNALVYHYTLDGKDFNHNNVKDEDSYNDTVNTAKIENNKGALLPETGGIGTTIFYLLGAILVVGAGVVFVTRRRMHSDK